MPKVSASRPPRRGTPCRVPVQCLFAVVFDVLSHLDDQTTFKLDETKSATSVSERASQRFKNHVDTTLVIQENSKKPKETGQRDPPTDQRGARRATPCPGGRLIADPSGK